MNTTRLSTHHCVPCEGGTEPLTRTEFTMYLEQIPEWRVVAERALERDFTFPNFRAALDFMNRVGELAESEGHHPDIFLHDYQQVRFTLTTHAIGGLSINDFVMAVKIDELVPTGAK